MYHSPTCHDVNRALSILETIETSNGRRATETRYFELLWIYDGIKFHNLGDAIDLPVSSVYFHPLIESSIKSIDRHLFNGLFRTCQTTFSWAWNIILYFRILSWSMAILSMLYDDNSRLIRWSPFSALIFREWEMGRNIFSPVKVFFKWNYS